MAVLSDALPRKEVAVLGLEAGKHFSHRTEEGEGSPKERIENFLRLKAARRRILQEKGGEKRGRNAPGKRKRKEDARSSTPPYDRKNLCVKDAVRRGGGKKGRRV